MTQFVEIVDSEVCESFTNLVLEGVHASTVEWRKHNFWPNNGVVGAVVGDGYSANGHIKVIQALPDIYFPLGSAGVK